MALPKLNVPRYKIKLPSDGRTVSYRPFLVKEEKLLLLATETGEQDEIVTAIKNIIKECTDISNVDRLSTFDIEYLFLQIRTKSVGESVEVSVLCPDDGETEVAISIPLDEIKVVKTRGHKKEIKLSDEIVITMGYPSLDTFVKKNFTEDESEVEQMFDMAASCVGCGMCEDVCPVNIKVGQFFKYTGSQIQNVFQYEPGVNREDVLPLLTFKQEELREFED
jgi:ferredoxin